MAKNKLTHEDTEYLSAFDAEYSPILETLRRAMQFKLDDYLVLYVSDWEGKMVLKANSYGAPMKYKVVHVTGDNIAFVKQVNKNGEPVGSIYSCAGTGEDAYRHNKQNFRFELDPDFVDAILLQDEYDPSTLYKSKKDIWKAVTKHNKTCKVKTDWPREVTEFFDTVNIGDTLWTSNTGFFLVQDKNVVSLDEFNKSVKGWRNVTDLKGPLITVLTIKDKNGNIKDVAADFFLNKALYKERPRTYKELNI